MTSRPVLSADGNVVIAVGGQMVLRVAALDQHDDLGVGHQVLVDHGGDLLSGEVRSISAAGDIRVLFGGDPPSWMERQLAKAPPLGEETRRRVVRLLRGS